MDVLPSPATVSPARVENASAVQPGTGATGRTAWGRSILARTSVGAIALWGSGCMALAPQLPPTDFEAVEATESRRDREQMYAEQQIYKHEKPQGMRYSKGAGNDQPDQLRSWQSLDAVLRSDAHSAAALPTRQLRRSRLFAALTVAAGILTVAGAAASAREGLNLGDLDAAGGVLLGGGLASVGFAITSGVFYGKSRAGYEQAVDVYNDSLGMRLGILDGAGQYIPPRGAVVDADGNVVLDPGATRKPAEVASPAEPEPVPSPAPVQPDPAPEPEAAAPVVTEPAADAVEPAEATPEPEAPAAATPADPASEPDTVAVPPPGMTTAALRLQPRG